MYLRSSCAIIVAMAAIIIGNQMTTYNTVSAVNRSPITRVVRLNHIFYKAQKILGKAKFQDFRLELIDREPDELKLKEMLAFDWDKDGIFEAQTNKKLYSLLKRYDLEKQFEHLFDEIPELDEKSERKQDNLKRVKEPMSEADENAALKHTFRDKRLDKLWKKAEASGFNQEELMSLHEEFQQQQDKLDEHYEAMNEIHAKMEKANENLENDLDTHYNHLGKQETPSEKKARLSDNMSQSLKDKYREIKKDIDKLHKKIISGRVDDTQGPFDEATVNELWADALKADFSPEELESLKEELEHYANRIKKWKHFENELERHSIGASKDSQTYGEEDDQHKQLKKKVKELEYKVSKTHDHLEKKIRSPKDEL